MTFLLYMLSHAARALDSMANRRPGVDSVASLLRFGVPVLAATVALSGCPAAVPTGSDAGTHCQQGATRTEACGACGTRMDTCGADSHWVEGTCLNQLTCIPGDTDDQILADGSHRTRSCQSYCAWGDWTETSPPLSGECMFGWTSVQPWGPLGSPACPEQLSYGQACDSTLRWRGTPGTSNVGCGYNDACRGTRRVGTSRAEEETCVPAGEMPWGTNDTAPSRTVTMTGFFISRWPTTIARYDACVQAGACTALTPKGYLGIVLDDHDPARQSGRDYVAITATYEQAEAFCSWDGGRRLPSAAQLVHAMGTNNTTLPLAFPQVGGSADADPCYYHMPSCSVAGHNTIDPSGRDWSYWADDLQPGTRFDSSGRNGIAGVLVFYEWTRSWFPEPGAFTAAELLSEGSEAADPEWPPFGTRRQMRGQTAQEPPLDGGFRRPREPLGFGAFRCIRPDE